MTTRQEFDRATRVDIVKRATKHGVTYCEKCGLPTKRFEIDHTIADGLRIDKRKKLTAEDGKLLCSGTPASCHDKKTGADIKAIAKAKRREAKSFNVAAPPAKPLESRNDLAHGKPKKEWADPNPGLERRKLFK